ncbi:MAG: short-chain dehydrogenase [Erythrobacter sp. RIFCSPHIGHO2_12_FULL_63_10]|nr:MAG: short-chain dehydrogenase [Erythrobacter sp. RIFCSPHIGHO2_12_FULL_63_10]
MALEEMFAVRGKAIVITGGGSGIGLAMAEVLAEHGARVLLLDIALVRAEAQAARLRDAGLDVWARAIDVADADAVDECFEACVKQLGGLDVLFANAGIDPGSGVLGSDGQRSVDGALENYDLVKWNQVIGVSLDGVFYCLRAAARYMKPQGSGSIIVTTSVSSVRAMPIGIAYSAAKAGAAHLMRNAALELARYNIRVNAIAPGPFITNIGDGFVQDPKVQAMMRSMIPLGRMGSVEEMKGLALFLASPASSFMTGAELFNDGGLALGPPID